VRAAKDDPEAALRVADDYLMASGYLLLAWAWAATARAAVAAGDKPFTARRLALAGYGIEHVLPQADVHWQRVGQVASPLPAVLAED
jgi:hypothetical protein